MSKVLFVISAAQEWTLADGSTRETGFWAEELVAPHRTFANVGWEIAFATPGGREPVVDEASLESLNEMQRESQEDYLAAIHYELSQPLDLAEIDEADYDVVFYPGGHGPMEDLAEDATSAALLARRHAAGRPLALLCHAPAALLAVPADENGEWPFAGYEMTAFSDVEEGEETLAKAKWSLEQRLRELGADYRAADPLQPNVVKDRHLFTGQNPVSSEPLAQRILAALR
ncbi:type 1 glutamine amidotransferase domain-containing protein [Corynebacterium confusum]